MMESSTKETTRPKAVPDFRVFEQRGDGTFELLTPDRPIKAANKKAAIRAVASSKNGPFLTIREKEYSPTTGEEARSKASKVEELERRIAELEGR
jgi:hypothetical protein